MDPEDLILYLIVGGIGLVVIGTLIYFSAPVLIPSLVAFGIVFHWRRKSGLIKIYDNLKTAGIDLLMLTPEQRDMLLIRYADGGWFEMFCATLPIKTKLKVRGKNYKSIGTFATEKGDAHHALTEERSQSLHFANANHLAELDLDATVSEKIVQSAYNKYHTEGMGWSPPIHSQEKYINLEAEETLAVEHSLRQEHREDIIKRFRTGTEEERMQILSQLMQTGQTQLAQLLTETVPKRDG